MNFITLTCPGHPIRSGKVPFLFIAVFLTDVIVEKQRNEIERTSARLRTFACHERNFNHVRLHFDLPKQFHGHAGPIYGLDRGSFGIRMTYSTYFRPKTRGVQTVHGRISRVYLPKKDRDADLRHIRICLYDGKIWVVCP